MHLEQYNLLEKMEKEEVMLRSGNGFKDLIPDASTVAKVYLAS